MKAAWPPPERAAAAYAGAGVRPDRPVLVVGAWDRGWGEEGRVMWDLAYLGHPDVHLLAGGMPAWSGARSHVPRGGSAAARFDPLPDPSRRATTAELLATLGTPAAPLVIDVRDPDEFAGATPHGEARGGHIPGGVSVPWRAFLAAAGPGAGLPPAFLAAVDARPDARIVMTCTGGVRSAMACVLVEQAIDVTVANHDDGMWGWARADNAVV